MPSFFDLIVSGDLLAIPIPSDTPSTTTGGPTTITTNTTDNTLTTTASSSVSGYLPLLVSLVDRQERDSDRQERDSDRQERGSPAHVLHLVHHLTDAQQVSQYLQLPLGRIRADLNQASADLDKLNELPPRDESAATTFEQAEQDGRFRLVLMEILRLVYYVRSHPNERFVSDILDNVMYQEDLSFILPIAHMHDAFGVSSVQVALALATCSQGVNLVRPLILNDPPFLYELLGPLLDALMALKQWTANTNSQSTTMENISSILLYFSSLSNSAASHVRSMLMARNLLPSVILTITTQFMKDTFSFITSILIPSQPSKFQWLKEYIEVAENTVRVVGQEQEKEHLYEDKSYQAMRAALRDSLAHANSHRVPAHLKLYAALAGLLGFKLHEEEAELVLSILSSPDHQNTPTQVNGICLLLVWEGLLTSAKTKSTVASVFKQIMSNNQPHNDGIARGLLVLLSAHFQTHQTHQTLQLLGSAPYANVASVIRSILATPVSIHTESLSQFSLLFGDVSLFPFQLTFQLTLQYYFNTHPQTHMFCLSAAYQLLKSNLLLSSLPAISSPVNESSGVDLTMWLWSIITQLPTAPAPDRMCLPPLLPAVIELVVQFSDTTALSPLAKSSMRVSEDEVKRALIVPPNTVGPIQVVALYYTLVYNEKVCQARTSGSNPLTSPALRQTRPNVGVDYSNDLLSLVPVRAIINHIHANSAVYTVIYPSLMPLAVCHFPQLFDTPSLLMPHALPSDFNAPPAHEELPPLSVAQRLCETVTSATLFFIHQLDVISNTTPNSLLDYVPALVDYLLPALARHKDRTDGTSSGIAGGVASTVHSIWFKIFRVIPWQIALRTIHALWSISDTTSSLPSRGKLIGKPSHGDLIADPLLVLRVDKGIWQSPVLVKMLLQILSSYMSASRRAIQSKTLVPPGINSSSSTTTAANSNDMESVALMMAQDSAAIQILLEAIENTLSHIAAHQDNNNTANVQTTRDMLLDSSSLSACNVASAMNSGLATEIITSICMFIHQMFIAQPLLAKLVHFQGYSHSLVPLTVTHVPSMHICIEFIPELLAHSHQADKMLFAINLAGYLVEKYPLPLTLPIAKRTLQILPQLYTTLNTSSELNSEASIQNIMENIGRICSAFPVLAEDALTILVDMAANSKSQERLQIQLATKALSSVVGLR